MPKVSVIMSVRNGEAYLKACIDSILGQTFGDFEFIIVDDASTDASAVLIDEYTLADDRVRLVGNKENLGLTKSLNIALKKARGEYIARMDADDIAFPERFEKQVKFLDENKDYGLVGSWAELINEKSETIGEQRYPTKYENLSKSLIRFNPFFHSSIMMRKSSLDTAGFYNEDWKYAQDYELFFRLNRISKLSNLPENLLKSRVSENSITRKKNTEQAKFALRARWEAIKRGDYSWFSIIYLSRPLASMILPYSIRKFLK